MYLAARSQEFLIRFPDAATAYLELGSKFPGHSRASSSLGRAEKLALAENNFAVAGKAALVIADRAKSLPERLDAYARAVDHFESANDLRSARKAAETRLSASKGRAENLISRLIVGRIRYAQGEEDEAVREYGKVATEADRYRSQLGEDAWSQIAGEAYFRRGEDARLAFEDFSLLEREGDLERNIEEKAKYFDSLAKAYQRSAENARPQWSAPSRYQLANAALTFATEIAAVEGKAKNVSVRARDRLESQVRRFRELAKKYHTQNVEAKTRNPAGYLNDEWVKKSSIALGGYDPASGKVKHAEVLPEATHLDLPYQWSL
jgi:tetratricopeptide (TPR) repeat protein